MERNIYARLKSMILGKTVVRGPKRVVAGAKVTEEELSKLSHGLWWKLALEDEGDASAMEALNAQYKLAETGSGESIPKTRSKRFEGAMTSLPA